MRLRKQKLLALFLTAAMAVTPAASVQAAFEEDVFGDGAGAEIVEVQPLEEETEDVELFADQEEEIFLDSAEEEAEVFFDAGEGTETAGEAAGEAKTVAEVEAMIAELPDLIDVTEEHRAAIEAAQAAYEALSAEDQKTVDTDMGNRTSQPYGRDLESAVWGLEVLKAVDNSTTLPDGTYDGTTTPAVTSVSSKGKSTSSRNTVWSVKDITVKDGQAFATIAVASKTYTSIRTNGQKYEKTNASGNSEFANVPIDLNGTMYIAGFSTSMNYEIAYTLTNTVQEPVSVQLSSVTNTTGMFKVVDASILDSGNGKYLYITLNSTGYRELYKGTYEEAVATGGDSAQWIIGEPRTDDTMLTYYDTDGTQKSVQATGKLQFAIPLSEDDSYIQIQALSNAHKKDGWWWYPRYIKLDQANLTLEAGDYQETFDLAVTNNVKMFSVAGADLTVTGGPHSNNYAVTSQVTMGSTSYDKAFVGSAAEAEAAAETIALTEDQKFHFTVETIKGSGTGATIETILDKPTVISFHSVKKDAWYERVLTFSKTGKTLVIDNAEPADYTAVDAALAKIPADLSIYTDESAAAVNAAKEAVVRDLYSFQQAEVDAMAKAIEDAVAALAEKEKPHVHSFGKWKSVAKATVFAPAKQERTCECGEKETRTYGKKLKATIKVNAKSIVLKKGQSTTVVKVSGLARGDSIKNWKSSNKKIVTVNKKGKITAKKVGNAKVTVTLKSGKKAVIKVKVQKAAVKTTKITGIKKKMTIYLGNKFKLAPVLNPITSKEKVTYKSSNKKVATVNAKGVINTKKEGTTIITVKSGKATVKCKVTVKFFETIPYY